MILLALVPEPVLHSRKEHRLRSPKRIDPQYLFRLEVNSATGPMRIVNVNWENELVNV